MESIELNKRICAVRMFEDLKILASFGPRDTGSPGEKNSLSYLSSFAGKEGIKEYRETCKVTQFIPQSCSLQVLSPEAKEFRCLPQDRSGPTPLEGITGEVLYVGCGCEQEYNQIDASGKLLLMDIWGLHLVKKIAIAERLGAKGCILINPHPGDICCAWGLGEKEAPMPVVSISYENGQLFHNMLKKGPCLVNLKCNVLNKPGFSDHLIMELPSKEDKNQNVVILIAHRDTTHISPGANDNASGMVVLLELLRVFKNYPLNFRLLFIFSAAEEGGGIGISQLVRQHFLGNQASPLAVINLDMLAVGSKLCIVKGDKQRRTNERLNTILHKVGAKLNYHLEDYEIDMGLADIEPFVEKGIPSSWIFKPDDPRVHTEYDLPEYVNPNDLKAAADIVANTLLVLNEQ